MATTRRFGPLYPGDAPACANGCHDFPQVEVMPADYPPGGWLGTCCASCGWMCQFHLRHGDRDADVYWVVDEDVPEDCARRMRGHTLARLRRHGYPRPAWAGPPPRTRRHGAVAREDVDITSPSGKRKEVLEMGIHILTGDARAVLQTLETESVHCCVTSPP